MFGHSHGRGIARVLMRPKTDGFDMKLLCFIRKQTGTANHGVRFPPLLSGCGFSPFGVRRHSDESGAVLDAWPPPPPRPRTATPPPPSPQDVTMSAQCYWRVRITG